MGSPPRTGDCGFGEGCSVRAGAAVCAPSSNELASHGLSILCTIVDKGARAPRLSCKLLGLPRRERWYVSCEREQDVGVPGAVETQRLVKR